MNKLISLQELSELVNKSKVTVWRWWKKDKTLPEPIIINGRCIGWKKSTIEEWLDTNTQGVK